MIPGSGNPGQLQKSQATQSNILWPLCGSAGKESAFMQRPGFDPWAWKIPWRRERLPLQFSCLQNSMDHIVYGFANSRTQQKDLSLHFQEISPESRLDWSLPVPSGVSFLKPAKTHTLAFAGSPLSLLDRKTSVFTQAHR